MTRYRFLGGALGTGTMTPDQDTGPGCGAVRRPVRDEVHIWIHDHSRRPRDQLRKDADTVDYTGRGSVMLLGFGGPFSETV